ncbi:uncharacterized protein [Pocillopora verrucosa]|uniref:uncharacterized protein isoform X2 n=1 Tax=Pocillopora verrucosa TaxID=203993 RepID=UPI00333ED166
MGHHIFFFSVIFITLVVFSSGADRVFTVKIHQRYLLACSESSDPGNLKDIDWYHCSPGLEKDGCDKGGKQFLIAQVRNMREKITYNPNFDVYTNGTLVIKKVLPTDDGVMFICSARVRFLRKESFTTILNIAKGMDLYMDALVQGYPYPSVTWSHDGLLLQNTWNNDSETSLIIRSVTVYESGQYTCYAKNSLGDDIFTVDVYVQDFQTPQSSLTSETQSPSASPPPKTQSPSTSPPPKMEDGEVFHWLTGLLAALLLTAVTIIIYLVVKIRKPDLRISDHTRGFESSTVHPNFTVDVGSGDYNPLVRQLTILGQWNAQKMPRYL